MQRSDRYAFATTSFAADHDGLVGDGDPIDEVSEVFQCLAVTNETPSR